MVSGREKKTKKTPSDAKAITPQLPLVDRCTASF